MFSLPCNVSPGPQWPFCYSTLGFDRFYEKAGRLSLMRLNTMISSLGFDSIIGYCRLVVFTLLTSYISCRENRMPSICIKMFQCTSGRFRLPRTADLLISDLYYIHVTIFTLQEVEDGARKASLSFAQYLVSRTRAVSPESYFARHDTIPSSEPRRPDAAIASACNQGSNIPILWRLRCRCY